MSLRVYRRHSKKCQYRDRRENRCRCKIWYDWHIDGKRITRPLDTRDWQRALQLARKIETEGSADNPTSPTVADGCERFLKSAFKRQLREASLYKYRLLMRQLEEFAASKGIIYWSNFNLDTVREFYESLKNRSEGAKRKLVYMRKLFGHALESGWVAENYAKKIEFPLVDAPPVLPFFEEDIQKMLAALPKFPKHGDNGVRLKALILLLWHSGLRIGDAVTLDRGRIVNGSLYLRTQKTGTQVFIPLPQDVLDALNKCPGKQYFFWSGESKRKSCIGDWQRAFRLLFKLAKITGGHPHRFRHGFAVRCLLSGLSMEQVAALLGHSDVRITQRVYAQWDVKRQSQLEDAVKKTWNLESSSGTFPQH